MPQPVNGKTLADLVEQATPPLAFAYALFERVNPERNEARYYYLAWQSTLFHRQAVVRIYGRIGETQHVLPPQPFDSLAAAWPLLRRIIRTRLRHGYRMAHWSALGCIPKTAAR